VIGDGDNVATMTNDNAPQAAMLPTMTHLIGWESGDLVKAIPGYFHAEPGETIDLGPDFDPRGTKVTVVYARTVSANNGERLFEVGVKLPRPGRHGDQS
jgi:hypothetical protein